MATSPPSTASWSHELATKALKKLVTGFHGTRRAPRKQVLKPGITITSDFGPVEHQEVGDGTTVDTTDEKAIFHFSKLDKSLNDLSLRYGQISMLAGDYYGTYQPISGADHSDKPDEEEQIRCFNAAWGLLAKEKKTVEELSGLLRAIEDDEINIYEQWKDYAKDHNLPPSWIYAAKVSVEEETLHDMVDTNFRTIANGYSQDYPGYIGLLLLNVDHFGEDALTAYTAGHTAACRHAAQATDGNGLMVAYAMNAFADHFLEDSFASGHIRTPRRQLQNFKTKQDLDQVDLTNILTHLPRKDLCANMMHNEDNALGIRVRNKAGTTWTAFGDDYLMDTGAEQHRKILHDALKCSVEEVYDAYKSKKVPTAFGALQLAPIPASGHESDPKHLAPLFKMIDEPEPHRRGSTSGVTWDPERTNWSNSAYTYDYWYATTYAMLNESGYFDYQMHLNRKSTPIGGSD